MDGVTTRVVEDGLDQGPLEKLELVAIILTHDHARLGEFQTERGDL